jgi:serine/threonine protein kinase
MTKDGIAKISDFGNAVLPEYSLAFSKMDNFTHSTRWTVGGNPIPLRHSKSKLTGHQAPELFDGSSTYSMKADVYALGMVRKH